ncbi:Alpha/Beta hydrolase protein [Clohesyomyces aquaticus]|uniref:Carboxylic ester hydrolase n=1 Tax=Clohesyomyces aquaticus TaxID=1231657 RepID=A0A1Y1ZY44_9PLEO|nr:Alpha/Beta hydrolase protein [Clohesyomyces aquaticus]
MVLSTWLSASLWACATLAAPHPPPPSGPAHPLPPPPGPPAPGHYPTSPTVKVKNGTIEGVHSAEYNQDYFLGVPFAQPPVGPLRFRVPQSINTSWTAPYSAKSYPAACVGYGSDDWPYPSLSEDCLYLNVVRPSGYEHSNLPVGFWIHGGGLTQGSSIDQRYNFSAIVQRSVAIGKPIIAVSVNYRLSMWGFPVGDEVVESGNANLGFRDQRLGMHWVKENIAAFGGDPSKVTIWGESAGGLSVGMHLTAYGGRDDEIFSGAIMQSGNPINYGTFEYNKSALQTAASQLGCGNATSKLDCLRTVPFSTLNGFINSTAGAALRWSPIIDGDFIQGKTSVQLQKGAFVHVPILDGANSDEGTAFGPSGVKTSADFAKLLETARQPVTLTSTQATQVLAAYPADMKSGLVPTALPASATTPKGAMNRRSDAYYGDVTMIAPRRKTCQEWSAHSVPAYCYRFNTIPFGLPPYIGVTHFQEVAFVFDNKAGLGYGFPGVSVNPFGGNVTSYFELADTMSAAWVAFIHDGKPQEYWPVYGGKGGDGMNWVFDANVTGLGFAEKDDWRKEGIDLINSWNEEVYMR